MSYIKCYCERCSIYLNDYRVFYSLYCACEDCRQAGEWGHTKGGRKPEKLQKLIYIRSDIKKIDGLDLMRSYQLRANAYSTRIYCKKCFSIIGIDHPNYKDTVFMIIPYLCKTNLNINITPVATIQMQDYIFKNKKKINSKILLMNDFKDTNLNKKFNKLMNQVRPRYRIPKGISFKELLSKLGEPTILNLKKGEKLI